MRIYPLACVVALLWGVQAAPLVVPTAISGTVLDPAGRPLGGASVELVPQDGSPPVVLAATRSGADGQFSLAGAFALASPLRTDPIGVIARHPQFALGWRRVMPITSETEVRLSPATALRLPLQDGAGVPVPGVAVRVRQLLPADGSRGFELPDSPDNLAVTNAEGVCRFARLPQGLRCTFATDAARWAVLDAEFDGRELGSGELTEAAAITLRAACPVAGRVTQPDGQPVADVRLVGTSRLGRASQVATTAADGSYRLDRLAPGSTLVKLLPNEAQQRNWAPPPPALLELTEGGTPVRLDLATSTGVMLTCRVVDQATNQPVTGTSAVARGPQGTVWQALDARGEARLRVGPGAQVVTVERQLGGDSRDVQMVAGEPQAIELRVKPLPTFAPITGQVLGPDGQPAAGVEVRGLPRPEWLNRFAGRGRWYCRAVTGADGRFALAVDAADPSLSLWAVGHGLASPAPTPATAGDRVQLRLAANVLGAVETTVTDSQGHPLSGAVVRPRHHATQRDTGSMVRYSGTDDEAVRTDAQGRARLTHLLPGDDCSLEVSAWGYTAARSTRCTVAPGSTVRLSPVALRPADWSVMGTVVDGQGHPVSGVPVVALAPAVERRAVTDAAGRFRVEGLPEGSVTLRTVQGSAEATTESQTGFDNAVLRLVPAKR